MLLKLVSLIVVVGWPLLKSMQLSMCNESNINITV